MENRYKRRPVPDFTLGNPQSNNLYAYTQNMPTDFVDPSGLNASAPSTTIFYFCYAVTGPIPGLPSGVQTTTVCHFMTIGSGTGLSAVGVGGYPQTNVDIGAAVTKRLDTGNCRAKLNALLKALGKEPKDKKSGKTGFDAIAEKFIGGKLLDTQIGGYSQYDPSTGRITLNIDPKRGEGLTTLEQILGTEFIHEGLHGAGKNGISHKDIVKAISKLEGTSFSDIEKERKALKGKDASDSSLYEQPMNEWIKKYCP